MEGFKVTTTLAYADWQALLRALAERANDRLAAMGFKRWVPALLWIALVTVVVICMQFWPGYVQAGSMLAAAALFYGFAWTIGIRQRRAYRPAEDGAFLGTTEFVFEPDHFEVTRAHSRSRSDWGLVRDVSQTNTHVMLWIDHTSAYTFRIADLPAPLTAEDAVARLRSFMATARANELAADPAIPVAVTPAAGPPPASSPAPAKPSVWQEMRALLRLETHGSVDAAHLYGGDLTLLALTAMAFALWIGLTRLEFSGDVEFMWFGLTNVCVFVVAGLLLAWALSRFSVPRVPMRLTALLVLAVAPVFVVAAWMAQRLGSIGVYVITVSVGIWIAFVWGTGLRLITGMRQLRAFFAAAACFLVLLYGSGYLFAGAGLWYQPDDEYDPSSESFGAREQLLFEQGSRIDSEIMAMAPSEPKRSSMYFVGFAGFGGQRVFAEEIGTAARTIAAKYATGNRQLLLVNDRRDDEKFPLASVSALRHALLSLGSRMSKDDDVLFLALSSHGSEDATISVSNETAMYWRDLSATDLRAMLDESGIRWKVIVISACHAGSFIESLADDHTIVLTAAAKENSSFGCSDDRDLTYFGEAFYRDSLPKAAGLRAAFEAARADIAKREKAEGRKPSEPQAHFGALMESRLAELDAAAQSSSVAPIR